MRRRNARTRGEGRIGRLLLGLAIGACAAGAAARPTATDSPTGAQPQVVFDVYAPLARPRELLPRMLSPLSAEAIGRYLAASRRQVDDEALDLPKARFVLHVPPGPPPPGGYAVLVFVPPWEDARLPPGWGPILDRHGVIFVTAAGAGNDDNVLTRRAPLALIALENVARRYPMDARRVWVGGFSGGSRVALRLALDFPDLFTGAMLNAGSDPIGVEPAVPPSPALMRRFQTESRIVYATGRDDQAAQTMDSASRASLKHWCVQNVAVADDLLSGHSAARPATLDRALDALARPAAPESAGLGACRADREAETRAGLAAAKALLAAGDRAGARRRLLALDASAGGMAGPELVALADACGCGLLDLKTRGLPKAAKP
jgi:predicted esterase